MSTNEIPSILQWNKKTNDTYVKKITSVWNSKLGYAKIALVVECIHPESELSS